MKTFRTGFFWKLYITFVAAFLLITAATGFVLSSRLETSLFEDVTQTLKDQLISLRSVGELAVKGEFPGDFAKYISEIGHTTNLRIGYFKLDGSLLNDSHPEYFDPAIDTLTADIIEKVQQGGYLQGQTHSQTPYRDALHIMTVLKSDSAPIGIARIGYRLDSLRQRLAGLRSTISIIMVFGILAIALIGYLIARRVTTPIREMVRVCEDLGKGRWESKIKTTSNDEIGQLGETLNKLGEEIKSLEKIRRDFVANVSHEIKTPLTTIKGYAETLLAGALEDTENNVRFVEKIDRNAGRLKALVQDLLSLAQIESSDEPLNLTDVTWSPIIKEVLLHNEDVLHKKRLKVSVHTEEGVVPVLGNQDAMNQVLDNLVTNAIRYTPEGGLITLNIRKNGKTGMIEVADTGIGIAEQDIGRIFERFYRVDKARSRDLGGTGLGLAIVKHLVVRMNGRVEVSSKVGIGSKFTVFLNLVEQTG